MRNPADLLYQGEQEMRPDGHGPLPLVVDLSLSLACAAGRCWSWIALVAGDGASDLMELVVVRRVAQDHGDLCPCFLQGPAKAIQGKRAEQRGVLNGVFQQSFSPSLQQLPLSNSAFVAIARLS